MVRHYLHFIVMATKNMRATTESGVGRGRLIANDNVDNVVQSPGGWRMAITRLSFHTKPALWPVIKCTCAPYICINAKWKDNIEVTKEVSMATIRTNSNE